MNLSSLSQIEKSVNQLSLDEQLWLIERLTQNIRKHINVQGILDDQLAAMSADPEIQHELRKINEEFAPAEADGLGIM